MKNPIKTFGKPVEGKILSTKKVPYCGQIHIWGKVDEKGNIIEYFGDTGGEFERDFTAKWTVRGYKVYSERVQSENYNI